MKYLAAYLVPFSVMIPVEGRNIRGIDIEKVGGHTYVVHNDRKIHLDTIEAESDDDAIQIAARQNGNERGSVDERELIRLISYDHEVKLKK